MLNDMGARAGSFASFGELVMDALIGLTNHMAMTGGQRLIPLPLIC